MSKVGKIEFGVSHHDFSISADDGNITNVTTGEYFRPISFKTYEIDFDKVKTIKDVVSILKGMDFVISDWSPSFEELKPYLKEHGKD